MHDDTYIGGRSENNINALCIMISGGRTKQLDIFCHVTGFTSDFRSFIVVELIRFFHFGFQMSKVGIICTSVECNAAAVVVVLIGNSSKTMTMYEPGSVAVRVQGLS